MKILFAAAECAPFAKVGGLADVVGSLPKALKTLNINISVILPYYQSIVIDKKKSELIKKNIKISFEGKEEFFDLWKTNLPDSDVPLYLVKNDEYFKGDVYSFKSPVFSPQEFEGVRFFFFMKAIEKISKDMNFDIIHCHDWHTSLVPFLLKKKIKTIFTIHNIAYQGIYDSSFINKFLKINLKGTVNCLQNGVQNADIITTVSPNYAKEILTSEFGFGLENDLKKRKKNLVGIINGLDSDQFNPEKDPYIKKEYSKENIDYKKENKKHLQINCFKKSKENTVVIGMVTRIADQKGFDLIEEILPEIIKEDLQLVILGKGMKKYEDFLKEASEKNPEKIFIKTEFNEELAHQIYAGADMFLMPSAFEPCGLGQMIAMRYGTVPIVRSVGGLKDTVTPIKELTGTGFLFTEYKSKDLLKEIKKALKIFTNKKRWKKIQLNCMNKDFTWKASAKKYLKVYKKCINS